MYRIDTYHRIIFQGIFFLLFFFLASNADKLLAQINLDLSGEIAKPKTYIIPKCSKAPIIDGRGNDACWANSPFTELFIDIRGKQKPKYDTRCKMAWDEENLYIYAELEEEHIWGDITTRDAIIYLNNDFEVFIDPHGMGRPYGEIEINALATVWDLLMTNSYRLGGKAIFDWNLFDMKSAVHHYGSLNNPNDLDTMWTVELAIPMQSIADLKHHKAPLPKEGDQWRINFSRVHWDHDIKKGKYARKEVDGRILPEYNWVWSPQGVVNMHIPEKWAYMQFTYSNSIENIQFIRDPDQEVKQVLYALFRHFRLNKHGYSRTSYESKDLEINVILDNEIRYRANYYPYKAGFEIEVQSPHSGNNYVINHESHLHLIDK